jgi:hypothetical protein
MTAVTGVPRRRPDAVNEDDQPPRRDEVALVTRPQFRIVARNQIKPALGQSSVAACDFVRVGQVGSPCVVMTKPS